MPTAGAALEDRDGDVRHFAGVALRQIGEPAVRAVPELLRELKAPVPGVRRRAAHALRQLGPVAVKAVAGLTTALADDDPEVRKRAAWALAAVGAGTEKATAGLTAVLADPDPDLRWAAAHALGIIGPKAVKAVPTLMKLVDDENADVCEVAAAALKKVRAGCRRPRVFLLACEDPDRMPPGIVRPVRQSLKMGALFLAHPSRKATLSENLGERDRHTRAPSSRPKNSLRELSLPKVKR